MNSELSSFTSNHITYVWIQHTQGVASPASEGLFWTGWVNRQGRWSCWGLESRCSHWDWWHWENPYHLDCPPRRSYQGTLWRSPAVHSVQPIFLVNFQRLSGPGSNTWTTWSPSDHTILEGNGHGPWQHQVYSGLTGGWRMGHLQCGEGTMWIQQCLPHCHIPNHYYTARLQTSHSPRVICQHCTQHLPPNLWQQWTTGPPQQGPRATQLPSTLGHSPGHCRASKWLEQ